MKKSVPLKKIGSLGLCLVLLVILLPSAALAVETYTTSEEGIALMKEYEDFRAEPYSYDGEWYIGYGTRCDPADYPDSISEEEGDQLLREALVIFEDVVNQMLMENHIAISQAQFDAILDMTYNLGFQWMEPDYRFYSCLVNGWWQYSEAEIVNAIATWCHKGSTVMDNLVHRRLRDAYLFLYGVYDNDGPEAYTYIHFDPNGGTMSNMTVFYPVGRPYGELPEASRSGHAFQGWQTTAGSVPLTGEEIAEEPLYATAQWVRDGSGEQPSEPEIDLSNWVNPYTDMNGSDWFYPYVRELSAKGVVGGYPDGSFQAGNQLRAGEALKLILMAVGYQDPGNAASGHWASHYLDLAESLGCLFPGEIVDLDGAISRQTIARVAAVAMNLEPRSGLSPFADVDDGYTLALYEEGILNGTILNGQRWYYPFDGITRAEMCAIVSRISSWHYVEEEDPAETGVIEYGGREVPILPNVPVAPYNNDLFVLDGSRMYYNDPNYATALGVDVARYQGDIDWQKVADFGIEFAFLRVGGRFAGSGELYDDVNFQTNLTGAKAAGLDVGIYFFSQAVNVEEAEEEARYCLEKLDGMPLEYPIVFDWELYSDTGRNANTSKTAATDAAIAFCETVARAGYTPMIYVGLNTAYMRLDLSRLTAYDLWFAQYNRKNQPDMYYNYRIWQYTDSGSVPGIEGKVDMDIAMIPY